MQHRRRWAPLAQWQRLGGALRYTREDPTVMNILIGGNLAYLIMTSLQLTHKPSRGGRQNKIKIAGNLSTKAFLN